MDNKIWFSNINLLFETDNLFNIIPMSEMSKGEKVNSITRFSLYLSILLYLATGNYLYLYIILITIVVTYMIYIFNEKEFFNDTSNLNNETENDTDNQESSDNDTENGDLCKKPTNENPLMNPLIGANTYENKRACNVENNKILEKIDKKFCDRLFQNTSNIFNNRNNQRAFYTMPNSQIVNDQTSFANWLYNTPVSCEIGNNGLLKQYRSCALNNKTLTEIKNEL
jgi:hypothetical protein